MKSVYRDFLIMVATPLLLGTGFVIPPAWAAEPVNDVRILIDISGSMKHNDPLNLRVPALRLLTRLLPKGAHAGVWTYGQYVNMLVPLGEVNSAWKDKAEHAATGINSFGLFTNIEDAMQRATPDWSAADDNSRRSLIMLTDGFVDVARDPSVNAAARERIINRVLPRLRDAKVKIYTIALSGEADHELLRQLSAATDGWSEEADDADKLQRIFLHLFEKATHPDTLPITGNHVQVDKSIEEITFLVFRGSKAKPTELVDPRQRRFGAANAPQQVNWHSETGYDLITVTKPEPGDWRVLGPEDADNRVMVVTNLKVRATQMPNNLSTDDTPYYFAQLMQGDTVIRRKDFLDLVKVTLRQQQEGGEKWEWVLRDDGKGADLAAGDGTFSQKLSESMKPGRHELSLLVDGTTFQRAQRQVVNIYSQPAQATITSDSAGNGHYVLSVIPYAGLIEPDTMQVTVTVSGDHGISNEVKLNRSGPAEWRAELSGYTDPGGYQAEFTVTGSRPSGKPVSSQMGPYHFSPAGAAAVDDKPRQKSAAAPVPVQVVKPDPLPTPPPVQKISPARDQVEAVPKKINWFTVAWQTLLINAVLITGGIIGFRLWRKSTTPVAVPLEEAET
jgi:uncharacterized protein (TIGR03503 family)